MPGTGVRAENLKSAMHVWAVWSGPLTPEAGFLPPGFPVRAPPSPAPACPPPPALQLPSTSGPSAFLPAPPLALLPLFFLPPPCLPSVYSLPHQTCFWWVALLKVLPGRPRLLIQALPSPSSA